MNNSCVLIRWGFAYLLIADEKVVVSSNFNWVLFTSDYEFDCHFIFTIDLE